MYSTVCMLHEQLSGVIIPHAIYHYLYSILSIILLHIAGNSLLSTSMRPTLLLLSWIMKVTIDASTRLCVCILSITITTTGRITSGAKALTLLRDGWRGRKGFVRSASENMLWFYSLYCNDMGDMNWWYCCIWLCRVIMIVAGWNAAVFCSIDCIHAAWHGIDSND